MLPRERLDSQPPLGIAEGAVANRSWRTVVNNYPPALFPRPPTTTTTTTAMLQSKLVWDVSRIKVGLGPKHTEGPHAHVFRLHFLGGGGGWKKHYIKIKNASKWGWGLPGRALDLNNPARRLTLRFAKQYKATSHKQTV